MERGAHEAGRKTLQRAVEALPQAQHVELISKFAQLEFRHGAPERGRTVFDGILSNYPKRVDVWSVYLDMEIRIPDADPQVARRPILSPNPVPNPNPTPIPIPNPSPSPNDP